MRYVALGEVVELHRRLLQATGGAPGIRDFGALESAVAQPKATFGGSDLYPTLAEKAAAVSGVGSGPPFRRWQQARRACRHGDIPDTQRHRDRCLHRCPGAPDTRSRRRPARSQRAERLAPTPSQASRVILSVQRQVERFVRLHRRSAPTFSALRTIDNTSARLGKGAELPQLRNLSTRMKQWVHEIGVGAPPPSLGA